MEKGEINQYKYNISPKVQRMLNDTDFYVLRLKKNNMPLNVSYTEDGLKFTAELFYKNSSNLTNDISKGNIRYPYFENALVTSTPTKTYWSNNTGGPELNIKYLMEVSGEDSNKVYIEKYFPRGHNSMYIFKQEIKMADKALRLNLDPQRYLLALEITEAKKKVKRGIEAASDY